jgi:hypothetical protein
MLTQNQSKCHTEQRQKIVLSHLSLNIHQNKSAQTKSVGKHVDIIVT